MSDVAQVRPPSVLRRMGNGPPLNGWSTCHSSSPSLAVAIVGVGVVTVHAAPPSAVA